MSKKTNFGKINGREAMVVGIIIVMVALFSILSPTFRTYSTFVSVLDMRCRSFDWYRSDLLFPVWWISDRTQRCACSGSIDRMSGTQYSDWCFKWFAGSHYGSATFPCNSLYLHDNKRSWFFTQWRIWCFLAVFLRAGRMVQKDFQVYGKWKGNSNWYCSCCSACSSYEFYIKTYEDRTLYNCYRK